MQRWNFEVDGVAIPQGSKNVGPRGNMYEANPGLPSWRQEMIAAAKAAQPLDYEGPFLGALLVSVVFVFPRPKAHYRTGNQAHRLRDDAPMWHTKKPDADKLQRALGDALKIAGVMRDDSQIAKWDVSKVYTGITAPNPIMSVRISRLED